MPGMKRIKQIIESFLNIGMDPNRAIASAWARVAASASTANQDDVVLLDLIISGVLQQAREMQQKTSKSPADAEVKS